jgi:hypothetical protein
MSRSRLTGLGVHFGVFVAASAVAFAAARKPRDEGKPLEVELWSAKPEAVAGIHYKAAKVEVHLTPQSDARGRYSIGKVTKTVDPPKTAPQPTPDEEGITPVVAPEPVPEAKPTIENESFVGVKEAIELFDRVATLRAVRSLGKVSEERLKEFGLTGDETGELTLDVAGTSHVFTVGERTPGGGDVYAQDKQSGAVYVLPGDLAKDVELADNRLMERDLLTPPDDKEVGKVVLSHGDKSRAVVHSTESPSFWTDESTPQGKNETLTNWMKKFERLRATEYVEGEPPGIETLAVAKFSTLGGEDLGQIEFAKQTPAGEDRPRYLARTPQTRWWTVVLSSTASELAADLPSMFE